ncbi:hypothetical protein B9T38_13670 [Acinetobacter sp. ANC 4218]|uniref:hypothetical protein n=1 Tax=Acinetobacter sp. ANC 4218 TaxID=1977880 RepID=UPI000A33578D|nr:hypothetical protein [Acinetobacter sp. ANC 4218]OTG70063.1 hypothetical protein B9T38_13670 [Acinetobacter sp. ANC 4218]
MSQVVVTTKEQLKRAVQNKEEDILLQGEVLKYYKAASKLKTVGKISLGIAVAGAVAAPFTAGFSGLATLGAMGAVATAAASVSLSTAALITFIVFMGVGLLFAIFNDYEEIEVEAGPKGIKLKLKKSKRK